MSRGFGTTFGTGANADLIIPRATFALKTKISISFWMYMNGAGSSSSGLIYGFGASPAVLAGRLNGNITTFIVTVPWSTTRGQWHFTPKGTGRWQHIVLTYDGGSTANVPTVYNDGVAVSLSLDTSPTGSYGLTLNTQGIGNSNNGADAPGSVGWDGMIAHFALWNGALLDLGSVHALLNGACPLGIYPDTLATYLPLDGVNNPEPDLILGTSKLVTASRLGTSGPAVIGRPLFFNPDGNAFTQIIAAALLAYQQNDYGALSCAESIAVAVAGWQQANNASLSCDEVMAATVSAYQRGDYGALSLDMVVASALAAYQAVNFGALTAGQTIAAALAAFQQTDYAAISGSEIMSAVLAACQRMDYFKISRGVRYPDAVLSAGLLNSTALSAAIVYNATLSAEV